MNNSLKRIVKICRNFDINGLYHQADKLFLKYSQVLQPTQTTQTDAKTLGKIYTSLQQSTALSSAVATDIFNIINKITLQDATSFIKKYKNSDASTVTDAFISFGVTLTNSFATQPSNKINASAITNDLKQIYLLPIFNNYFNKYPQIALIIGFIVLEMVFHPVDQNGYSEAYNFMTLYAVNASDPSPDPSFTESVQYLTTNLNTAIASLSNEGLKTIIESEVQQNIVTKFLLPTDPSYKLLGEITKNIFKTGPFDKLVASTVNDDTTNSSTSQNNPKQAACNQALSQLGDIDPGIMGALMNVCDYVFNGFSDYPSFHSDLLNCGFIGSKIHASKINIYKYSQQCDPCDPTGDCYDENLCNSSGSSGSTGSTGSSTNIKPNCSQASQELSTLYNSIPSGYQYVLYDESQDVSMLGINTSDALTTLLTQNDENQSDDSGSDDETNY